MLTGLIVMCGATPMWNDSASAAIFLQPDRDGHGDLPGQSRLGASVEMSALQPRHGTSATRRTFRQ
jgi:hypothetical protein